MVSARVRISVRVRVRVKVRVRVRVRVRVKVRVRIRVDVRTLAVPTETRPRVGGVLPRRGAVARGAGAVGLAEVSK